MIVRWTICLGILMCAFSAFAQADESTSQANETTADQAASNASSFAGDPNSAQDLTVFASKTFEQVAKLMQSDPDQADEKLDKLEKDLDGLTIENTEAQQVLDQAIAAIRVYRNRLELERVTIEELQKRLKENPDDAKTVAQFISKVGQTLSQLVRTDPEKAAQGLSRAKDVLTAIQTRTKDETVKRVIDNSQRAFAGLERRIASAQRIAELVGQDAAPLNVETWVNGEPLGSEDLQGKVVLLDFWAMWCGPCIATFPHLREWQEQYSSEGLVIVGLTNYYNFKWDADAGRAQRSQVKVTHEDEQAALTHFAEQHELKHRFAIQSDRTLSDFYGVSGIPHAVLIDRQGKVRLVRVGSGEANAKEIGEMLAKLIAE